MIDSNKINMNFLIIKLENKRSQKNNYFHKLIWFQALPIISEINNKCKIESFLQYQQKNIGIEEF